MSGCERVLRRVLKETNRDSLNESVCVSVQRESFRRVRRVSVPLCQRVLKGVLKERKSVCVCVCVALCKRVLRRVLKERKSVCLLCQRVLKERKSVCVSVQESP
jgi:hypothetical protein